jgi:hypothetical protein
MDLMRPLVLVLLASSLAGTLAVAPTVTVSEKSSDDSAVRKILQGYPTYIETRALLTTPRFSFIAYQARACECAGEWAVPTTKSPTPTLADGTSPVQREP